MKLGITGGLEYYELESEKQRLKSMNGKLRCKAHNHLVEQVDCADCAKEGTSGDNYRDFFEGDRK